MIKGAMIRVLMKALPALAAGVIIAAGITATAHAEKKSDIADYPYCVWYSGGNEAVFDQCVKQEQKIQKRLEKRKVDPKAKEYCKTVTVGSYAELEKCINSVDSPEARKKRKEREEKLKKKQKLREGAKGIRRR